MKNKLILIGAPAAGKGTLSRELKAEFGIPHISIGSIFRKHIEKGTELGKKVEEYVKRGELVPNDIVLQVVEKRLQGEDCQKGFALDGFPRTLEQAELLDTLFRKHSISPDIVINIHITDDEAVRRSSARRHCKDCGAHYNLLDNPPKVENCDACHGELVMREDDKEEIVRKRLKEYHEVTEPILEYYKEKKLLKIFQKPSAKELAESVKRYLQFGIEKSVLKTQEKESELTLYRLQNKLKQKPKEMILLM